MLAAAEDGLCHVMCAELCGSCLCTAVTFVNQVWLAFLHCHLLSARWCLDAANHQNRHEQLERLNGWRLGISSDCCLFHIWCVCVPLRVCGDVGVGVEDVCAILLLPFLALCQLSPSHTTQCSFKQFCQQWLQQS
jgi:hypothetical protein